MKKLLYLFVVFLAAFSVDAQSYLMLYNFDHVNQNLMVNPASPSKYRFVLGIPGLSGHTYHVNSSSQWSNIFEKGSNANTQFEKLLNDLTGKERINLNQTVDVLFVGFGTKNGYFSLGAQEVTEFNMTFPGELMKFLYYGNLGSEYFGKTLDLSDFDASLTSRVNYHIGYQHQINDKLSVGGRYKYISGIANVNTDRFKTSLYTDIDKIEVSTDILFQTSGITSTDIDVDNITEMVTAKNAGMAFDLGVQYQITEKWDVSASVVDFGWINWKRDLKGYESKGTFVFEGFDYEYIPNDSTKFDELINNTLDSIDRKLNFQETDISSYRTNLPTHILASTQFAVNPHHVFGLVYHGTKWGPRMYHSYGVNYIGKWHKMINFTLGYSVIDNRMNHLTAGLSLRLGFFQVYVMTDNAFALYEPHKISATSVRAGINISFFEKPEILKEN